MMHASSHRHRTWVEINKHALFHNYAALKRLLLPRTRFMAVVKSNAYGHGLKESAELLSSFDPKLWFGVDSLQEAAALQELGIRSPILILGYTLHSELPEVVHRGARQVVYNHPSLAILGKAAEKQRRQALLHLKIETGTARQGIHPEQIPEFARHLKNEHPHVLLEGAYTHFADAENPSDDQEPFWKIQLRRFHEAIARLRDAGFEDIIRHSAASAASMLYPETHFDMARFGIALYGLWPSPNVQELVKKRVDKLTLKPVLSWKTKVAQVKHIPAGNPVGYGLSERVSRDTKLAVLPVGYWDGFDRGLSSVGEVLISGERSKILGRVCMNMVMIDVTDIPDVAVEDEVALIGTQKLDEIRADEIAEKLGTINYEVVTRINPLIPRVVV